MRILEHYYPGTKLAPLAPAPEPPCSGPLKSLYFVGWEGVAAGTSNHRRGKTAFFLAACGWAGAAPHWLDPSRSLIPAFTLAVLLGGYGLRTLLRRVDSALVDADGDATSGNTSLDGQSCPTVDVVVAARDEEAVVTRLVERLAALRYPTGGSPLCVVDDGSEDHTPERLSELQVRFPSLKVIRRPRNAGGGKSGPSTLLSSRPRVNGC